MKKKQFFLIFKLGILVFLIYITRYPSMNNQKMNSDVRTYMFNNAHKAKVAKQRLAQSIIIDK